MRERRTRQLEATYEVVRTAWDHPTAEQVHTRVRQTLRRVSLSTVYRNLQKLLAQGRIRIVQLGPRSTRFDGMLAEHQHFVCESCGAVVDLPSNPAMEPAASGLRQAGYGVRRQALTFFGVCRTCRTASKLPGLSIPERL